MYRCIGIAEDQQSLQKIIWRNSPNEKLQEFQMCTVSYGQKSAAWLALRTLRQLASDDQHKFPEAAEILQNEFFVDDLVSGHNSLEQALKLQQDLINLLKGGGMNLRKWTSNHPALLENLSDNQKSTKQMFDFKTEESTKTLGLGWNSSADTFLFNWNLQENKDDITKRYLLSEISQLYDPLGWLAPITVTAKLLFQRVWVDKLNWNDKLPTEIQKEWRKLKNELPEVKNFKLNRWIGGTGDIDLLGFCDASEKAFACVVYSRVQDENGQAIITLLAAKTRVSPLKQKTTLPRLELNGALLLSQLIEKTMESLTNRNITVQAWCDSQIVLAWIQADASRWEPYIANRTTKIKAIIPAEKWNYIKSDDNPADCASRGLYPSKLKNHDLWWDGPQFLRNTDESNVQKTLNCLYTTEMGQVNTTELKTSPKSELNNNFTNELLNNNSSLAHVTRVTAWVARFSANALNKQPRAGASYLTAAELIAAMEIIIKCEQRVAFETEYKQLSKKEPITSKSSIYKLNPYLDEKGIIRVGGRLNKSSLSPEMKNPAILPKKGRLTRLVIDQAHARTLHGGARLTLAHIRQKFWIISGNRTVKAQLRHCVRCHRFKPTENVQLMADLPQQRTSPSRPFTHTGMDFTGHVDVKLNKGRGVKTSKGYIVIFVCMATKAVHMELVSDLTTEAFLAAFQRFCHRRGTPKHCYSDCGTNFIGASKRLRTEFNEFKKELAPEFFTEIGKMEVEWHFNAPAWPTAGGVWEAAVKSAKYHLRRVLGDQKLTYEEFLTLLTQIEACLNSRPLCPLTEDPEEFYNYLTPGHFLTGSPTLSLPLSDYSDDRNMNLQRRWQLTEHMAQQFWKNWSTDYLHLLQTRCKWNKPTTNIKEGEIVLIKEDNLPPARWALGRVLRTHPGTDGRVRVTTLKTKNGIMKRPVTKLSPLPIETSSAESENKTEKNDQGQGQQIPPENSKTKTKTSSSKIGKAFVYLCTLLTLCSGTYGEETITSAQITSFESDRPVYYDTVGSVQMIHDEWILLMYCNLSNYWDGMGRIKTYFARLNDLCEKTDPRYCTTTLNQLQNEMELLDHYNSILLSPNYHLMKRKKRGLINGVGYVANSLFGVLDQRFADKYQEDIKTMQNNQNYLLQLIKNQTSIVELENAILKKSEKNIQKQFSIIDDYMKQTDENIAKIETQLEEVMASNYFNSASLAAFLLMNSLRRVQELLFDSVTSIYKGHMNAELLSPTELINQLHKISGRLPKSLSLPLENINDDIKDLYQLLYVKARITNNYFLFEIHIPLITDEDFILHRIIPIPIKTENGTAMVQLSSNYIAVDLKRNKFISLSSEDMQKCTQLKQGTYTCDKNLPVLTLSDNNSPCEAKLLAQQQPSSSPCVTANTSCKDAWTELHAPNSWLTVCCDICTLRIICNNDVTTHVITTPAIVSLAQDCVLQSKELTIYSHNIYNTKMNMGLSFDRLPTFNKSINKIVNFRHDKKSLTAQLLNADPGVEEIDKRLASQKIHEISLPASVSSHDLHQNVIIYTMMGALITIITVWTINKRCPIRCKRTEPEMTRNNAADYNQGDLELQPAPPRPRPRRVPPRAAAAAACKQPEPRHPAVYDNVVRRSNSTAVVSGRGMDYYDDHDHDHDHHPEPTTTARPARPRYTDPWAGYYDWIINEGSFKFWSVFQIFTAALLLYACLSAIYYAKFNPIIPDYDREYDDYFLERTVGRQARSLDSWELPSGSSWINPRTFQFILDAISKHYENYED
ncbi:unnamed protein product [Plutella xylostella]|uniref:(diamondback moth) hypothetical protein n=1 Tax=Plutella xylostella TaxID=51655 RepID=A0A8S4G289_PLUXY|nr:unnamed protein product [Plutella xylostella]